jgi:hypothetical protein
MAEEVYYEVRTLWPDRNGTSAERFNDKHSALQRMDVLSKDFVIRTVNAELRVVYVCHIEHVIHSDKRL